MRRRCAPSRIPTASRASFVLNGVLRRTFGSTAMALFHLHHDDTRDFARESYLSISRILRRIDAAFKLLHRGIVSAKLRRVGTEMLFRPDYDETFEREHDASKFPHRPLILGDKWDF
jgi:hypothetical protein